MAGEEQRFTELFGGTIQPGMVVAGKYRVDRLIGTGGMGVVVEAHHLDLDDRVALKLLHAEVARDDESLARFEREARSAFKIQSEHVARVLDVGKLAAGTPYMVMEYLQGVDLATELERGRLFQIHEAVDLVIEACDGVASAHGLGIVHRDLKPENLFLDRRPDGGVQLKVLDFGISKVTGAADRMLTGAATTLGTPQYMAPEQWMSSRDVAGAADIWALGVILYELCAGKLPFEDVSLARLCAKVLEVPPTPIHAHRPEVSAALEKVILRCLEKKPQRRYATARELAAALAPFASPAGRASAAAVPRGSALPQIHYDEDELGEAATEIAPRTWAEASEHLAPRPQAISSSKTPIIGPYQDGQTDPVPPQDFVPPEAIPTAPPIRPLIAQDGVRTLGGTLMVIPTDARPNPAARAALIVLVTIAVLAVVVVAAWLLVG
jgi:eukaryotic-like serine/threonine-protein kinase